MQNGYYIVTCQIECVQKQKKKTLLSRVPSFLLVNWGSNPIPISQSWVILGTYICFRYISRLEIWLILTLAILEFKV